jgi:hypothetical protein
MSSYRDLQVQAARVADRLSNHIATLPTGSLPDLYTQLAAQESALKDELSSGSTSPYVQFADAASKGHL